jgi:hypothetical protein
MDGYEKQHATKAKTNPLPLLLAFQIIEVVVVLCGCFDGGKNAQILCFCNVIHLSPKIPLCTRGGEHEFGYNKICKSIW